ncbi:MAG: competence/damage-inducible protein A [Myxococcales bacterium]|nr:competence/damage-inducible protein A [Myxococcales bacterium]
MTAAVFTIGTEVIRGELLNTNAQWLADRLIGLGWDVSEHISVPDEQGCIIDTLVRLKKQCHIVVVTGGLGPTSDDLTASSVAKALGVPLVRDKSSLKAIETYLSVRHRPFLDIQKKQADVPRGARVLLNAVGTAPGFAIRWDNTEMYFLPGVPSEMKPMFEAHVAQAIQDRRVQPTYQIRLRTYGLPEAEIAHKLTAIEAEVPDTRIGYRAHFPETEVKVLARGQTVEEAKQSAKATADRVHGILGDIVYGEEGETYAGFVGKRLVLHGLTLAVAESCTGGLVGEMLTEVAGSSQYLLLDAVSYSNASKVSVLGVDPDVLQKHGAVSKEVAIRMAEGVRKVVDAHIGVSVTGIAGPSGGSSEKPVGTVWIGLAIRNGSSTAELHHLAGSRSRIRTLSAYLALARVIQACAMFEKNHVVLQR